MHEARLASIFDISTAALAVLGTDGRILEANPALATIGGCEPADLVGMEFWGFAAPGDDSLDHWPKLLTGELAAYDAERRYVTFDGREVVLNISLRPCNDAAGVPQWFVVSVEDRTEQRRAEAEIRAVESRFTSAFERAPVGMALVDLDGRFLRVNGAFSSLVGRSAERLLDLTFQEITHPDDLDADLTLVEQVLARRIDTYDMEKRFLRPDGTAVWALKSVSLVRDDDGVPRYFVSQFQDIAARKEMESTLEHRSMHDALTGLPNRTLLVDRLTSAAAKSRTGSQTFAVLFVDVDGFKAVNDDLGHAAGDEVLVEVGVRLSAAVRASDTVARFGGDEFVVLAELGHPDDAAALVERITEAMSEPVSIHGAVRVSIGASVGTAVARGTGTDPEALLLEADAAMYRIKRARREVLAGLA